MKSHLAVLLAVLMMIAGCSKKEEAPATSAAPSTTSATAPDQTAASQPPATGVQPATTQGGASSATKPAVGEASKPVGPVVIPSGTTLSIRTTTALGSDRSQPGDTFAATLMQPIEVDGRVVVPKGAEVTGKVVDAKKKGKIKGEARLELTLTGLDIKGRNYPIRTTMTNQTSAGKGKRTAVATGGGAGLGAIIGGIAGGGKGAGIGALVGGGAGLVGGAFTGNKQIELPAESALVFKLNAPVTLK